MRKAIAIILDGLRRDFITPDFTPSLSRFGASAERFASHSSVFPSATRVVSSCFATGCHPLHHGLQGNSLALLEGDKLVPHDAGHPDFLQHRRRVTGRSLDVPTLAERLAGSGGSAIFSNVSPGAAYAHDPDGFGYVYHRSGSFGPGRVLVAEERRLRIGLGVDGDAAMAERFIDEVLVPEGPALGVLWLSEPDTTQHSAPLGSPQHLEMLSRVDALAGRVIEAAGRASQNSDDVLIVAGSDHGHQTVAETVDIAAELVEAGFKADASSGDVVVAANGTAALIYLHPDRAADHDAIERFLRAQEWAGKVFCGSALSDVGQAPANGLAFAVAMACTDEPNDFGVPGKSLAAKPAEGKADRVGFGQHGGLGTYEQSPFLFIAGPGFQPGGVRSTTTSIIDLAPTILTHLGLPSDGTEGNALQILSPENPELHR